MMNKKDPFHTAAGSASSMKETKSGDGFRYGASIAPSASIKKALSPKAVAVSRKVAVAPAMTVKKAPAVMSKMSVVAPKAAYKADKDKMAMIKKLPMKPIAKRVKMAPMKKIAIKVKK